MKTGDRLRMLRSARDLTQKQVADRAGIQRVTYTRAESNKRSPQRLTVEVLAEALEVPQAALIDDVACMRAVSQILGVAASASDLASEGPLVDEARRLASQLSPDGQTAVATVLRGLVSMQAPPPPLEQPSRGRPVADGGRRGAEKGKDSA